MVVINGRPEPLEGEMWLHFKGKTYTTFGVFEHTETGEKFVAYRANYGDGKGYVRPLAMFMSKVDREKYPDAKQEYRFERKWIDNV